MIAGRIQDTGPFSVATPAATPQEIRAAHVALAMAHRNQQIAKTVAPPTPPRGPGAFRPSMVNVPDSGKIGVGILTYLGLEDVERNLPSVVSNIVDNCLVLVYDNSDDDVIGRWVKDKFPSVRYVRSEDGNVGCSNGRNRIAELLGACGCKHVLIQDQDVGWRGDVVTPMLSAFATYPHTGVVTWELALKQMGSHTSDSQTGLLSPPECPGMCCMYSLDAIKAVGGWNPEMFMYRFDSLFCLQANKRGYAVRRVVGCENRVAHNHPHSGIRRYPWVAHEQARSRAIFKRVCAEEGIELPHHMRAG